MKKGCGYIAGSLRKFVLEFVAVKTRFRCGFKMTRLGWGKGEVETELSD
jgi:hypothetical protein